MTNLVRPKLRDRNLLEGQLAAEIALGALSSLDDAIQQGHIAALEYGAQLLFDNIRKDVACQNNLPQNIACYLYFDRNFKVRQAILNNFSQLPPDYQEDFISTTITELESIDDLYHNNVRRIRENKELLIRVRKNAIENGNDTLVVRLLRVKHMGNLDPTRSLKYLRHLPETVRMCYDWYKTTHPDKTLIHPSVYALAHPDEKIRLAAVKHVMKMTAGDLRKEFPTIDKDIRSSTLRSYGHYSRSYSRGDIRKAVYMEIAEGEISLEVQMAIVGGANHQEVLKELENMYVVFNPAASKLAHERAQQIAKRTAYSQAYQERKRANSQTTSNPIPNEPEIK